MTRTDVFIPQKCAGQPPAAATAPHMKPPLEVAVMPDEESPRELNAWSMSKRGLSTMAYACPQQVR